MPAPLSTVRTPRSSLRAVAALTASLALLGAACAKKPASIRVSPTKIALYGVKRSTPLTAEVLDKKGRPMPGVKVSWESGKSSVATVDDNGAVKSVGAGKTVVTASVADPALSATCAVEVVDVASITISPSRMTVAGPKGTTVAFKAEVKNSKGNVIEVKPSWVSSDPKVATVDKDGNVASVSEGRATVTASLGEVSGAVDMRTTFREIGSFEALPLTVILKVGEQARISATAKDPAGVVIEDAAAVWASSDPKVATCVNGVVTAVAPGNATIKVQCGPKTAEVSVLVS